MFGRVNMKPQQESEKQGPQYKLSTVLVSGSKRLAVIDDRVYAEGDEIGGETISSITLDHVVLNGASGERLLEVSQPRVPINHREHRGHRVIFMREQFCFLMIMITSLCVLRVLCGSIPILKWQGVELLFHEWIGVR